MSETSPGPGPELVTFGCRLNSWESEIIRRHATAAGLTDAVIVNTCAVTEEAERQARQAVRRARRDRPHAPVLVTGCAAQIAPERWAAMPEVTRVIGNGVKLTAAAWQGTSRIDVPDLFAPPDPEALGGLADAPEAPLPDPSFAGRARGFVEVQTGCDHRCTFCIIPYGRGNSRSVPAGEVVRRVASLVAAGYREVALTGVDVTSWGGDLPGRPALGRLVRQVLAQVPDLGRLRLASLDPVEIDDALWLALAEEPRLAPHLHLSIQAGSDLILKRMKRRHLRDDVLRVAARARALRADVALGADLIAGFPTETEAMFAETEALVAEAGLTFLHVFPYSPRPGTPAARIPPVPPAEVRARAARLRGSGAATLAAHLRRQVGRTVTALVERPGRARAPDFSEIDLTGDAATGDLIPVALTEVAADGARLLGACA